jgi:DNA polymerase elongation subunit (family B)
MLAYRCGTRKDKDGVFFSILKALRERRLMYKIKGKMDPEAKAISEALKIVINSAYGMLGSTHPFNDLDSAERVCAYGRAIVRQMMTTLEKFGASVIETDTDGVMFTYPGNETDYLLAHLLENILLEMPKGLEIEEEFTAKWVYVDAAKNYIIDMGEKIVRKGNFRKRNMQPLYREFTETFCRYYLEDPAKAQKYYEDLRNSILARTLDVKNIAVRKKIGKAEKVCLKYGNIGDQITVYRGYDEKGKATPVLEGPYHIVFYTNLIDKWYKTAKTNITTPHELKGKCETAEGIPKTQTMEEV